MACFIFFVTGTTFGFYLMATPDTDPEKVLHMKLHDLQMNYSDARLKQLLAEHGLDNMPFTVTTRNVLLKKLAQKILNMSPG
ncbi:unnamed protein product, partial [Candidula unifasciata]